MVAVCAVRRPRRADNLAGPTPLVALEPHLLRHHRDGVLVWPSRHVASSQDIVAQELVQLLRCTRHPLDELPPRDDPGVGAASRGEQRDGQEEHRPGCEDHEGMPLVPGPLHHQDGVQDKGDQDAEPSQTGRYSEATAREAAAPAAEALNWALPPNLVEVLVIRTACLDVRGACGRAVRDQGARGLQLPGRGHGARPDLAQPGQAVA
mmetsp:Transcript_2619/g.5317  ORF Transcript_2619/g.5317 Transcript_2619/m.5317 type:complete len:207 (-) Transcript_2619:12-632(-)